MSKMTRKPKTPEAFVDAANQTPPSVPGAELPEELPWEAHYVRDDVLRAMSLRLPEPYLLKLRFIAERTPWSMQRFVQSVVIPAIDREVERLLGGK